MLSFGWWQPSLRCLRRSSRAFRTHGLAHLLRSNGVPLAEPGLSGRISVVYTMRRRLPGPESVRWWDGPIPLLRREIRATLPQHILLNLAGGRLRKLRQEGEAVRGLEMGQVAPRELAELLGRDRGARF